MNDMNFANEQDNYYYFVIIKHFLQFGSEQIWKQVYCFYQLPNLLAPVHLFQENK